MWNLQKEYMYIHIGWVGTGYYLDFQPTKKLTIHSGHLGIVTCFGFFLDFFLNQTFIYFFNEWNVGVNI